MALIDKASLLMVPSTYEAGKLYNVLPSGNRAPDNKGGAGYDQTRADFDFDRGSNAAATRINSSGLIEKYRENLALYSQDFSNAVWNKSVSTFSGDTLTAGAGTTFKGIIQNQVTQGVQNISFDVSYVNHQWVQIGFGTSGSDLAFANYDIQNKVLGSYSGVINNSIQDFGTSVRISITINAIAKTSVYLIFVDSGSVSRAAATSSTGSFKLLKSQIETGLVATDYLNSTSVTAKAGVLIDLPRINYDANGENGALLLEPSRQQLYPYSEYSGAWTKSDWTTTDNYAISPEGVKNAFRAVSANNSGIMYMSGTGTTGQDNTLSVYAKSNTGTNQKFRFFANGNTTTSNDFIATTEWKRFDYPHNCTNVTAGIKGASSELSDILFYGFQQEASSYVSSYIPNHGTSGGVTRAADSCTGGGSAESINSVEGVLYGEISSLVNLNATPTTISISDGTSTNFTEFRYDSTLNNLQYYLVVGGVYHIATITNLTDITDFLKVAIKWKVNDFAVWINGVEVITATGAVWSANTLDRVNFTEPNGTNPFRGNTKQVAVFNEALSDSELATLTTL